MKAELRPASEMKDSGIEWVGHVPLCWNVVPIRNCFDEVSEKNGDGLIKNALKFKYGEIIPKTNFDADEDEYVADTILNYYVVSPGVIMINGLNLNFDFITQRVGLVRENGVITSAYLALKLKGDDKAIPEYMTYLLKSYDNKLVFHNLGGGVRKILNFNRLKSQKVILPMLLEQKAIVDYLDDRCSRIDEIIEEATASIEEYKELKQAVIFEAVTKGLDKNIPMKESGIEWIGKIPCYWELRKVKTFSDIISKGTTPSEMSNTFSDLYCIRYLKSENIKNNELASTPEFFITKDVDDSLSRSKLCIRDILFVIAGASIGKVAMMHESLLPANTNQANCFIRIKETYYDAMEYLWFVLQSNIITEVINRYIVKSAQPNISMENLGNIRIPFPKKREERNKICAYLHKRIGDIDFLISEKQSLIADLQSYKKSLIYEVVTGKRRVV